MTKHAATISLDKPSSPIFRICTPRYRAQKSTQNRNHNEAEIHWGERLILMKAPIFFSWTSLLLGGLLVAGTWALLSPALATGLSTSATDTEVFIDSVQVDLQVRGGFVAGRIEYTLDARFGGPNTGTLRFPLPPGAVLHRAELYIPRDERWEVAETMGRREGQILNDEAKGDPEEKKEEDPLLIQTIGPDLYRAQVYPIVAGTPYKVRVYYAHALEAGSDGSWNLRVAQATSEVQASTPARGLTINVVSDAGAWQTQGWQGVPGQVNLATAWQDSIATNGTGTLTATGVALDSDYLLRMVPTVALPEAARLRWQSPHAQAGTFEAGFWWPTAIEREQLGLASVGVRRIAFVVDVSSSMFGEKLRETKKALHTALDGLADEDAFALVAFSTRATVFSSTLSGKNDRAAAHAWVDALEASGSTGMAIGLESAMQLIADASLHQPASIVLFTDGLPTDGSNSLSLSQAISTASETWAQQIRVYALGIGKDLEQGFLNELVAPSGGQARFALDDQTITGQAAALIDLTRQGGLDRATLTLTSADQTLASDSWNRSFPGNHLAFGASNPPAGPWQLSFSGYNATAANVSVALEVAAPDPATNGYLASLAAPLYAKFVADQLEREIDDSLESSELVQQAVLHAKRFGIVTRYSSLLALDSPELYELLGITRIPRDLAGVALVELEGSKVDESQVGGEGANDDETNGNDWNDGSDDWQDADENQAQDESGEAEVACSVGRARGAGTGLICLGYVVLALGRRRRMARQNRSQG